MNRPLTNRFIIALVLLIIIPAASLYYSYMHAVDTFKDNSYFTINNARVLANPVLKTVEKNYDSISDYDSISKAVLPQLEKNNIRLQIIDLKGNILYDSNDKSTVNTIVDIKSSLQYDEYFHNTNPDFFKISFPIVIDGVQSGSALFIMPSHLLSDSPEQKASKLMAPIITGLLIIVLFIGYLMIKIIVNLLIPVRSLKKAAYDVSRRNLDTPLKYDRSDELSTVFVAFDTMRVELRDSLEKQEQYERAHKQLIACISHDLKTPISSIKAYIEALGDGLAKDRETYERYISVIKKKTDSLTKLIEDLFLHSQMQLQKLKINREEVYSRSALKSILEPLKIQFRDTDINFIINEPFPDVLVNIDSQRIEQVIVNMVSNSKKYMQDGGLIEITCTADDNFLKITISDTGPGILPQDIPHIFDAFYRGQSVGSSKVEGSGLGLSICKYIIEEHGGTIFVKSRMNEGTTFTFTIPKV